LVSDRVPVDLSPTVHDISRAYVRLSAVFKEPAGISPVSVRFLNLACLGTHAMFRILRSTGEI